MTRGAKDASGPAEALPQGTYVSLARSIGLDRGGRTGALLMRARILSELGGRRSLVATYDDNPGYDAVREALTRRGQLAHPGDLVNLFEDLRARPRAELGPGTVALHAVAAEQTWDAELPDGTPRWRTHVDGEGSPVAVDHLRPDGSVFLRVGGPDSPHTHSLVDHDGLVVRTFRRRAGLLRAWLRDLVPRGDAFVVADSRFTVQALYALRSRRFHVLEVVHNPHTVPDYRWDRPIQPAYQRVLDRIPDLDGLVLLTDRQRRDVGRRYGETTNLFTVANPVWPAPAEAAQAPRERAHVAVVARLAPQKRVDHALEAVARARVSVPDLTLSVYGDGALAGDLAETTRRLGLQDAVTFHGHDPHAKESLRTATALLVTSVHEGYPLSTLEAMSRGCPVVGYDVPYGMREQVADGVNGFLVGAGDVTSLAARLVRLARDENLVARMSRAARDAAGRHTPQDALAAWTATFTKVRDQAGSRTVIERWAVREARLQTGRGRVWRQRGGRLTLDATIEIAGTGPQPGPRTVNASLDLVGTDSPDVVSIPLDVRHIAGGVRIRGGTRLDSIRETLGDQRVRARIVVVWQNSARLTTLAEGPVDDLRPVSP